MKRKVFLLFTLVTAIFITSVAIAVPVDQNGVDMLTGARNALQLYRQYGDTTGVNQTISQLNLFLSKYTEPAQYVGQAHELLGDAYYLLGDYGKAVTNYKDALGFLPKSSSDYEYSMYSIGYTYMNTGNSSDAVQYLSSLYNSPKYGDEAKVLVGSIYVQLGKYSEATSVLNRVQSNQWKAWAIFYEGKISFNGNDFSKAQSLFETVQNYSNDPNVLEPAAYYEAYSFLNLNQIGKAVDTANKAINNYPPTVWSVDLYTILGEAYYRNGQYSTALNAFQSAIQLAPNLSKKYNALNAKAWTEYKLKNYKNAVADWEEVLNNSMDSNLALSAGLSAGASLRESKDFENAIALYKQMEPKFTSQKNEIILQEGKTYLESGKYGDAVTIFDKLSKLVDPVSDSATYWLAYTYNVEATYTKAISTLKTLIANTNSSDMKSKAYMLEGDIYFKQSQYPEAESAYQSAIAIGTAETKNVAEYNLGLIYYNTSNYSNALKYLGNVMKNRLIDPDLALNAAYYLSQSYVSLKDYKSAVTTYDWITTYDFENVYRASVYVAKAFAMEKLGEYKDIPAYVDGILKSFPNLSTKNDLLFYKADAYMNSGDLKSAYDIAAPLSSQNLSNDAMGGITYIEGKYFQSQNDSTKAAQYFKEVYMNYPSSSAAPKAAYDLGMMYYRLGKYSDAKDALFSLVSLFGSDPNVPEAFYYIGMSYENLGQNSAAVQVYNTILDKFPNSGEAALAKQRLAKLGG